MADLSSAIPRPSEATTGITGQTIQRPLLIEAIALCEELQDYVSRELLEDLLEHCEEAIDWLETQQSLIEDVSLPNYLQAHMEPGEG
jgi:bacterioferritin